MHFQILERQCSILVFDNEADVNYCASCQVFLYGDVGLIHTVNGHRFYEFMAPHLAEIMRRLGVKSLEGYVIPAHARLMKIALRRVADVTEGNQGTMAGHDMVWIVVRPKGATTEHLLAQEERQ